MSLRTSWVGKLPECGLSLRCTCQGMKPSFEKHTDYNPSVKSVSWTARVPIMGPSWYITGRNALWFLVSFPQYLEITLSCP